jgi:hypothetical protein
VLVEAVAGDEIDSDATIPRYPLHSYPHVVLISPLHTPCRRHINTGLQGLASLEIFLAGVESFLLLKIFNVLESFLKTLGLELVLALLRIVAFRVRFRLSFVL